MNTQNPIKRKWRLPSRRTNWILFGISAGIGISGILLQMAPGWHNPLCTLGEYLSLSFLFSILLVTIIGFQGQIKNQFLKALFHALLISLCFIVILGIVFAIISGGSLSDFKLCLGISLFPFYILCPSSSFALLLLVAFWGVYLTLMALSLKVVRKSKSKKRRIVGYVVTVSLFGTIYAICYYLTLSAVAAAIAYGAMMNRWLSSWTHVVWQIALQMDPTDKFLQLYCSEGSEGDGW